MCAGTYVHGCQRSSSGVFLILLYYAFGDRVSASGVHRQVCTTAFGPSVGVSSPCLCSTFLLGHLPRPAITFDYVLVML